MFESSVQCYFGVLLWYQPTLRLDQRTCLLYTKQAAGRAAAGTARVHHLCRASSTNIEAGSERYALSHLFLQQFDMKIFVKQFWNKDGPAAGFVVFSGRDGNKSCCILYYRFADVARQSTMVFTERTGLENLYSIVAYCTDVTRWVFLLWSCWKSSGQMRCLEPLWCESCGLGLVQMTDVNGSVADRWGVLFRWQM